MGHNYVYTLIKVYQIEKIFLFWILKRVLLDGINWIGLVKSIKAIYRVVRMFPRGDGMLGICFVFLMRMGIDGGKKRERKVITKGLMNGRECDTFDSSIFRDDTLQRDIFLGSYKVNNNPTQLDIFLFRASYLSA